jgi:dihydroflavonol-4-reductase
VPGLLPRRVTIEPGDRVVVTGATGFIGSAVTRAVRSRGAHVVALTEPGADCRTLAGTGAERVKADIRDRSAVTDACSGARFVFHLAAIYRFWARDPRVFYEVNVGGTLSVLAAVRAAGCERLLYTSTIGVLNPRRAGGRPGDETCYADMSQLHGAYKGSKFVAEHEVLRACAEGLDACLVLPTFPLGPGDAAPTPTGRVVLDYLNGKMPGFADTAMNVVHVDDLAAGHVAALERGGTGRSYIIGGENLSMRDILAELARCTGLPAPRLRVPRGLILAATATCPPAAWPRSAGATDAGSRAADLAMPSTEACLTVPMLRLTRKFRASRKEGGAITPPSLRGNLPGCAGAG